MFLYIPTSNAKALNPFFCGINGLVETQISYSLKQLIQRAVKY